MTTARPDKQVGTFYSFLIPYTPEDMDDILMGVSRATDWNREQFQNFKSECYERPLKLEEGKEGVFLETQFIKENEKYVYRLKNDNEETTKVWRYHHWHSNLPMAMKRATMLSTLRKVHKMASSGDQLVISASAKLNEFKRLLYPVGVRKYMCAILARDTSNTIWRYIRNLQQ